MCTVEVFQNAFSRLIGLQTITIDQKQYSNQCAIWGTIVFLEGL